MLSIFRPIIIGCIFGAGLVLTKWLMSRYTEIETEIDIAFSETLPDGDYVVNCNDDPKRIRIKKGKTYCVQ